MAWESALYIVPNFNACIVDAKHSTPLVCEWSAFVLKQNIESKSNCYDFVVRKIVKPETSLDKE